MTLRKTCIAALSAALLSGCGTELGFTTPYSPDTYSSYGATVQQNLAPVLPAGVSATSITIDPGTADGRVGQSMRFNVVIKGSDGKIYTDQRLAVWTLSNSTLGVVDQQGVLTPSIPGTVKVTAMIGSVNASATVQVAEAQFAWQQMVSPAAGSDLHAVKIISQSEAWAGGDHGMMLHYLNGAWSRSSTFNFSDVSIKGLGFANVNAGWAVGQRGTGSTFIARWTGTGNGGTWRQETLPETSGTINAVSVVSDHDVWAVGQDGDNDSLILHYDGFNWKAFQSPGSGKLNAIHMLSAKSGWAVGENTGLLTLSPLVMKFENGTWTKKGLWDDRGAISVQRTELTGVQMVSDTVGYAVGITHPVSSVGGIFNDTGAFLTYDPKHDGWVKGSYDQANSTIDQVPLHAIKMLSGTEGWALGQVRKPDATLATNPQSIFGNLLANDNGTLKADTNYFSGSTNSICYGIDLLPTGQGFVVGQNGYILQRTYDWRNGSTGYSSGTTYGSTTGSTVGPSSNQQTQYGPGGNQVPGTQSTTYY